jgi:GalNAc-alpha-(1->4)-GalNAc-alpha-(1->3)-diNAcBac-PP-undecaprenol alpha-1,4-N-acetyl-D-galactosaminyltransferase
MSGGLKKICIVAPCLTMGGMERASSNLANGLAAEGYEVHFVAVLRQEKFFSLDERIIFHEPSGFNEKSIRIGATIYWLRQLLHQIQPDATLVFGQFYSALTVLAAKWTRHQIFISERSSPLLRWPTKIRWFNRAAFWLTAPTGVIAQTSVAAEYQRRYYGAKVPIEVIPNALREVKLYPEVARESFILAVGRFNDPLKGFDRLIEAFSKIRNQTWRLVFAGGDENGEALKSQAARLGVLQRIDFQGKVNDLDPLYARAGLFVIPSRSEGFPNALCEAMAAGVPCVSFDFVAGPRDIIQHGVDGWLVPDGDVAALAQKIDYLIDHPTLRTQLGVAAQEVRVRYQRQAITRQLLHFLEKPTFA